jgi:hypothetical protein
LIAITAVEHKLTIRVYPRRWSNEEGAFIPDYNSAGCNYRDFLVQVGPIAAATPSPARDAASPSETSAETNPRVLILQLEQLGPDLQLHIAVSLDLCGSGVSRVDSSDIVNAATEMGRIDDLRREITRYLVDLEWQRHGDDKMSIHPAFADWYRSATINPPEGLLQHRWTAIEEIAKNPTCDFILGLLRLFALPGATEAAAPEGFRTAFLAHDEAFPSRGNLQELRVLAGATLRRVIEEGGYNATLAALGLLSAAFGTRLAWLSESDHVDAAERYVVNQAKMDHSRTSPIQMKLPSLSKDAYDKGLPPALFSPPQLPNLHEALGNLLTAFATQVSSALR